MSIDATVIFNSSDREFAPDLNRHHVFLHIALLFAFFNTTAAQEREIAVDLPGGVQMEFVWIEAGSFLMGSHDTGWHNQQFGPPRTIALTEGFYLGKYEVTNEQLWSVMKGHPNIDPAVAKAPKRAAANVWWHLLLEEIIPRMNTAIGGSLLRLPTEIEWEYAARAGTQTLYYFGDDPQELPDYAWFQGNTRYITEPHTRDVGFKKPNAWGLYDMLGNAWEFCWDYTQEQSVIRGGSYMNEPKYLTVNARYYNWVGPPWVGFRLVLAPPIATQIAPMSWGGIKQVFH